MSIRRDPTGPALDPTERAGHGGLPPGPRAPQTVQVLRFMRDPVGFMRDCERRYGPVFTVRMVGTPGYVFVSDPELAHQVFATDRDIGRAGAAREAFLEPLVGTHSLLTLDGHAWTRQRKMLGSAFHGRRIERYRDQIAAIAAERVRDWPSREPFALRPRFQLITLEVILRVVFGVVDTARVQRLMRLVPRLLEATEAVQTRMFLVPPPVWRGIDPLLSRIPGTVNARFAALREATDALIHEEIAQRRAAPDAAERTDILSVLLAARDPDGRGLTDVELRDSLMTLLLAGHETTATALSWCFERLLRNPGVHERARAAAREGDTGYLDALAKETLRTRPVVGDMPRVLTAPMVLGDYHVPEGWWISPAALLLHGSSHLFPEPEEFRPERFLGDGAGGSPLHPHSWIPFGGGRRQCLGAQFAMLEMRAVLPEILSHVRLRPAGDTTPEKISVRHVTMAPAHGTRAVAEREPPETSVPPGRPAGERGTPPRS